MADAPPTPDDDEFWFQRAGSIVLGTSDRLVAGAERIASAMVWFWTVYTAAALLVTTTIDWAGDRWQATLLVAPAILLFAAYFVATWAALPIEVEFDDRRPDQIKAAHDTAVAKRWARLKVAVGLAALAAAGVVATVVAGAYQREDDESVRIALADSGDVVLVGGRLSDVDEVVVSVAGSDGVAVDERIVAVLDDQFSATVELPGAGEFLATVSYADGDRSVSHTQTVEVP